MKGAVPVEVFGNGERWQAREISPGKPPSVFSRLGRFTSAEHGKTEVEASFESFVKPWQMWGTVAGDGDKSLAVERMLTPYDVISLNGGKWAALDPEDRTHIIHAPTIPPGARIPPAACGVSVNTKCFISTKANIEPSCRGCAEVWRKEYQGK
jgi:hypothetical protein